jgi:hypothetical protein
LRLRRATTALTAAAIALTIAAIVCRTDMNPPSWAASRPR